MADDDVEVCDWTGDVPRVGETIMAAGQDSRGYRGKWTVTRVRWMMRTNMTGPATAEVDVEPACEHAAAWLGRVRAERAKEAVTAAGTRSVGEPG
ncbi:MULTISPECIES: hypothetical protein [Sorangium]|nr:MULTISPECIES: hypothetical protein [Sorangium]